REGALMMIPGECPGAAGAAAVAREREVEGHRTQASDLSGPARRACHLPACESRARRIAQFVAQENPERAALARRKAETARRGQVGFTGKLRHHGRESADISC